MEPSISYTSMNSNFQSLTSS